MHKKSLLILSALFLVISIIPIGAASNDAKLWKQFSGTNLTFIMNEHPYTEALQPLLPEFEKLTGIKVKFEVYPEAEFLKKKLIDASSGVGQYDGGMMADEMPAYVQGKWVEPLDKYFANPKLMNQKWFDMNDVSLKGRQWLSMNDKLYGMPVTFEGVFMFYRKDLFAKNQISVPQTYEELLNAAKKLNNPPQCYGIVMRGSREPGQNVYPWASFFRSYGGEWFDKKGRVTFDNKKGVAALDMYVNLLKNYGPSGAANYGWYEATSDFMQGKAAIFIDASIFATMLEDPAKSTVSQKIGYAQIPAGPTGIRKTNLWYWSLAISSLSKHKEAAAQFIAWASSKDISLKVAAAAGGSARSSIWEQESFQNSTNLPKEWFTASLEAMKIVDPDCQPKMKEWWEFQNYVGVAISEAIAGAATPEQALKNAAKKTQDLMKKR
jgi:multiple sugar transport system substrate-binding protein